VIDPDILRSNVDQARAALAAAAARAGRDTDPELLLAGKYVAAAELPQLLEAGVTRLGENRLQELEEKVAVADGALEFDFIGHLQRRKVKAVLPLVRLIHSVDSTRLAAEIAGRAEGSVRVLVEVNIAQEASKSGILPSDMDAFIDTISDFSDLRLGGLMVMPPATDEPEDSRRWFAQARELAERLAVETDSRHDFGVLSMGTSQDFLVAAEEGATIVRVGRGLIEPARVG
jgi:pyridoxal phosphate enzyme (YggS family)